MAEMCSLLRTLTPALHNTWLRHTRIDVMSRNPLFLTFTWGRKLDRGRASSSPSPLCPLSGTVEVSWTALLEAFGLFSSCWEGLSGGRAMSEIVG